MHKLYASYGCDVNIIFFLFFLLPLFFYFYLPFRRYNFNSLKFIFIVNLASVDLSDLLIPLAEFGPPLLLPELLELLFDALFFLLALVLANVLLDQSVDLFGVLCLV